jgi:hypothetical protein
MVLCQNGTLIYLKIKIGEPRGRVNLNMRELKLSNTSLVP